MFAILQFLSIDWHESILQQQKTAAASCSRILLAGLLKELKHPGIPDEMRQKVALTMSTFIKKACVAEGFVDVLDEIIPTVLCAISSKVRPFFQAALLDAVPGATYTTEAVEVTIVKDQRFHSRTEGWTNETPIASL